MDLFSDGLMVQDMLHDHLYPERESGIMQISKNRTAGFLTDEYINDIVVPEEDFEDYFSPVGLHAWVYHVLDQVLPLSNVHKLAFMRGMNAAAFALMFTIILWWCQKAFGSAAMWISFAFLCFLSPCFYGFARNLYYVGWTFLFGYALFAILTQTGWMRSKHYFFIMFLAGLIAGAVRFLCSFEYTPIVMMGTMLPVVFYWGQNAKSVREFVWKCLPVGLGLLAAFFLACGVKVVMLYGYFGNFAHAWEKFMEPIKIRVLDDLSGLDEEAKIIFQGGLDAKWYELARVIFNWGCINLGNFTLNFCDFIMMSVVSSGFLLQQWLNGKLKDEQIRKTRTILLSSMLGFLAPFSWILLGKSHIYFHMSIYIHFWTYFFLPIAIGVLCYAFQMGGHNKELK